MGELTNVDLVEAIYFAFKSQEEIIHIWCLAFACALNQKFRSELSGLKHSLVSVPKVFCLLRSRCVELGKNAFMVKCFNFALFSWRG